MDDAICHRDKAKGVNHRELQRVVDLLKQHIVECDFYEGEDLENEEEEDFDKDRVGDEYGERCRSLPSIKSAEIRKLRNIFKITINVC